ncbi:extracellular solute-binding protein [Brucella gallinifaecis]|uniref:Sugar ABC transporter substrate-binding protein n=1 Tax=Brucella gallinifaecis TaxID=215590 RepID=A0A502BLF6_9HYPH|nr:sugar ABC transporter substrate-binding protein [Brucella gallinifaecis]TPF74481.1 sugar ABC transporter substrate-binding protein [Brucella gallinifaecis]
MFQLTRMRGLSAAITVFSTLMASSAIAQTTINFIGEAAPAVFAPVIEAYEKANPEIKIEYQQIPFEDLNAAVQSRVGQGDNSIDIYAADTPRIPAFASKGYMLDLEDLRPKIEAAVPNKVAIGEVSYDGKIYAFPMWNSTQLLYFNRDLLKKAGMDELSSAEEDRLTWEEFLEKARALQKSGTKWGWAFQQVDRYYQLQPLFESAGAGSGLTGDAMLTPDLLGDKWIEVAKWYGDQFADGLSPRGVTPNQSYDLFINGETPFMITGPWAIARFNKAENLNYGVAPMPYFKDGKPVTPTGSWSLAINPHAANLEEAKKFLEFATLTGEGSYLTVSQNPLPPVNAEGFKLYSKKMDELTPRIGSAIDIITYETEKTAVSRPRSIGYVAFETILNKAFADIRNGADAEKTLQQAQDQLKSSLGRIR